MEPWTAQAEQLFMRQGELFYVEVSPGYDAPELKQASGSIITFMLTPKDGGPKREVNAIVDHIDGRRIYFRDVATQ